MKTLSAFLSIVVILLIVAFFFEQQKSAALQASVVALSKDRDAMSSELQKLNRRIADVQQRVSTPPPATPTSSAPPQPPEPVARPGVTIKAPAGWHKNGAKANMYVAGVDSVQTWGGMPSAYVESLTPTVEEGFGGMMQTIAAENYIGKRIRLSGWVKTEEANQGGGHLWLRIDGQERNQMLGFDNMDNRPVKGTADWQEASVVLDVPDGASALAYGFFVSGGGKMWVNGQKIEEVGPEVPTTNMLSKRNQSLPKSPSNLGFDPNRPK